MHIVKPKNHIDKIINKAIQALSIDCIELGVKYLNQLASEFNKAGLDMRSFLNMRIFIIESAIKDTKNPHLYANIQTEEAKQRETREKHH